jgi:hypothetical protein
VLSDTAIYRQLCFASSIGAAGVHSIWPQRAEAYGGYGYRLLRMQYRLNGCAGLALVFPVLLAARTFRLREGKGSGFLDTVVGSDSLDSDLACLILR